MSHNITHSDGFTLNIAGIRLVDQKNSSTGVVEVYHDGEWRSVCNDYWTDVEADVACGQLGFLSFGEFKSLTKLFVHVKYCSCLSLMS